MKAHQCEPPKNCRTLRRDPVAPAAHHWPGRRVPPRHSLALQTVGARQKCPSLRVRVADEPFEQPFPLPQPDVAETWRREMRGTRCELYSLLPAAKHRLGLAKASLTANIMTGTPIVEMCASEKCKDFVKSARDLTELCAFNKKLTGVHGVRSTILTQKQQRMEIDKRTFAEKEWLEASPHCGQSLQPSNRPLATSCLRATGVPAIQYSESRIHANLCDRR
nr:hypothetical protein Iba_chr02aCG12510 [Ipomoea batatas]